MTCDDLRDAIVELARGGRDAESSGPLREHLAHCPSCAGRLQQQQAVTDGLRTLAATSASPSEALEARLLAIFDAAHASVACVGDDAPLVGRGSSLADRRVEPQPVRPPESGRSTHHLPVWMRTAAMVALATGAALAWWALGGPSAGTDATPPSTARMTRPGPTPPSVSDPQPPTFQAANAAGPPSTPPRPAHGTGRRPAAPRVVTAQGFVSLPGAADLPDFDSGEIVRMEIPVTALPLYGIAIPPDAADAPVRADLLVAQDGRPRAIRLVTNTPRQ